MNKNLKSHDLTVAVDIGTTKVCAIAARKNEHNKLEIVGFGKVESEGVLRGVVSNIEKTVNAITEAVRIAEGQTGTKFSTVNVGIAGQHIRSLHHRGILTRDNPNSVITDEDIDKLIKDMGKLVLPPGDQIIHVLPQEFTVDNEQGITDPKGMSGVRLEANFHIITGQVTAYKNIVRCIEKAGLKVGEIMLEPIASAEAVLSDDEKDAGIALVDIGGGTTDITIFKDGIIRHTAVIPFGGNAITKDIKEGCTVMPNQAEKLKVKFGSALAEEVYEERIISIPGIKGHDPREISEINLARIIQARVEEILDFVVWEIKRSGYERRLIGGMVLTGGGALLNHIKKLAAYHTGMSVRIGSPRDSLAQGYLEEISSPMFSTGIGLLLKGKQQEPMIEPESDFASNSVFVTDLEPEENNEKNGPSNRIPYQDESDSEGGIYKDKPKNWLDDIMLKTRGWFTETDE